MTASKPKLQDSFAPIQPDAPAPDTMALIVDIQSVQSMAPQDAQAYLDRLGAYVDELRVNNIPVTWVTMGDRNHLFTPAERSEDDLIRMGFEGLKKSDKSHEMFREFMRKHGPRNNEAVYMKFYKSAFMEPKDYAGNDKLRDVVQRDYNESVALPEAGAYPGQSLTAYAHSKGTKNIIIAGAVSSHCVTEAALGGRKKGFNTMIWNDGVLSWNGEERDVDPRTSRLVWRGGDAAKDPQAFHRAKINARLDQIAAEELDARGITLEDIKLARGSFIDFELPGDDAPDDKRTYEA
jgi:nicotinamidase-related amidase